jgi:hypothetical protein
MVPSLLAQSPAIKTVAIPRAVPGQSYSYQLVGACYNAPCTWSALGSLPSGFSLSNSGVLSGLSGTAFDITPFTVKYSDKTSAYAQMTFYMANQNNRTVQWPHTVKSTVLPYAWLPNMGEWLRNTFDVSLSGNSDLSAISDSYAANLWYIDGSGWYPASPLIYVVDVATSRGWTNYEDAFLHAKVDYAAPAGTTWSGLDQFDAWDEPFDANNQGVVNAAKVRNGVLLYHNSAYQDISVGVYKQYGPYTMANGDSLYIGYSEPYDLINFTVSTGRSGGSVALTYWNGSKFNTLSASSDTTRGLSTSGTVKFTPPSNWSKTSVNGSHAKYWVQVKVTGASTSPKVAKITGDTWLSNSGSCSPNPCNVRGWSTTDGHRVNRGLGNLEYNPTPPSNATARFRYQGRATGYWEPNYLFGNPNAVDSRTGDVMLARAKSAEAQAVINGIGSLGQYSNGVFFDNIGGNTYWTSTNSDLPTGKKLDDGYAQMFQQLTPLLKSAFGADFDIGANLGCNGSCQSAVQSLTSLSLNELAASATSLGYYYYASNNMDGYATGTHKRILAFWDTYHFQAKYDPCGYDGFASCVSYHYWPQGDLSPMHTLAGYLIGMNDNTVFEYNMAGWWYVYNDEVYVVNPTSTTLSQSVVADTNFTAQTIRVTDGSSFQNTPRLGYVLKIGNDWINATKVDNNTYSFNTGYGLTYLTQNYPPGTPVQSAMIQHLATDGIPNYQNVFMWTTWFPAMSADYGQPDGYGWNGGKRGLWMTGAQVGGSADCASGGKCPPVWRRDFTNALVLQRAMGDHEAGEWETPSNTITLPTCSGCNWQRLHADGTLDAPTTTVNLKGNESAIFLKSSN